MGLDIRGTGRTETFAETSEVRRGGLSISDVGLDVSGIFLGKIRRKIRRQRHWPREH